jgi:hypothetical protein
MARSRPAQGNNSNNPSRAARAAYVSDPAPKVVSSGSVSHPKKPPSWRPGTLAADRTPRVVQD